jgi:hypothetical protein
MARLGRLARLLYYLEEVGNGLDIRIPGGHQPAGLFRPLGRVGKYPAANQRMARDLPLKTTVTPPLYKTR